MSFYYAVLCTNFAASIEGNFGTKALKRIYMRMLMTALLLTGLAGIIFSCEGQVKQKSPSDSDVKVNSFEEKQRAQLAVADTINYRVRKSIPGVDFRYAARKVTPGVVHVNTTWKGDKGRDMAEENDPFRDFFPFFDPFRHRGPVQGSASGVIVTNDGYIITNNHVIEKADEIEVVLHDQRSYKASVIGTDTKTDLALIKIDEEKLSFIPFGNSDEVEVGEWVLAVGNPFNLASTVTAGIVSAKARNINILKDREAVESFIQTDAAVNPGNSGGALVNLNGELIGINTAIATPTGTYAGYAFAIPVNLVKKVADDLLNFGTVQRGYLGVMIRDMTGSLAKELNVKFTPGVYVDSLVQDGAAREAGIKPRDIITEIDNVRVESSPELQEIVAKHRPGEKLSITLLRNNQERQVSVKLKGPSSATVATRNDEASLFEALGIDVLEISSQEKKQLQLENGLKVTRISKGRISEFTTMKAGFVITGINGTRVRTKGDLAAAIGSRGGAVMIEGIYPGSKTVVYYGFGM